MLWKSTLIFFLILHAIQQQVKKKNPRFAQKKIKKILRAPRANGQFSFGFLKAGGRRLPVNPKDCLIDWLQSESESREPLKLVNLFRWLAQRWALESTLENFFQQWLAAKFSMILLIFDSSARIS